MNDTSPPVTVPPHGPRPMNPCYRFFCWAGGANISILREMPTEQNRFFGYGTVICMTAVFAMLSSGYAFSLLWPDTPGFIRFLPALAWGSFIFILDRFFIVTLSSRGSGLRKLMMALPRLILAVFIGVIISKPLEFRIFQREILDQLQNTVTEEVKRNDGLHRKDIELSNNLKETEINKFLENKKEYQNIKTKIFEISNNIKNKDSLLRIAKSDLNSEIAGVAESGESGYGTIAKLKQQTVDDHKNSIDSLIAVKSTLESEVNVFIKQYQNEVNAISVKYEQKQRSLDSTNNVRKLNLSENYKPSILNQQIALAKIQNDKTKPSAGVAIGFITFLFIFIEMAPMLLKLMTKAGAYESRIAKLEATYSTEDRLSRSLDIEEYKSNRTLVQKLARSQRNIINQALTNWHQEQMNRMEEDPDYFNSLFTENREP